MKLLENFNCGKLIKYKWVIYMVMFLTSNLNHYHKDNGKKVANEIDNINGLVDQIKAYLKGNNSILFISANSKDIEKNNEYFEDNYKEEGVFKKILFKGRKRK